MRIERLLKSVMVRNAREALVEANVVGKLAAQKIVQGPPRQPSEEISCKHPKLLLGSKAAQGSMSFVGFVSNAEEALASSTSDRAQALRRREGRHLAEIIDSTGPARRVIDDFDHGCANLGQVGTVVDLQAKFAERPAKISCSGGKRYLGEEPESMA